MKEKEKKELEKKVKEIGEFLEKIQIITNKPCRINIKFSRRKKNKRVVTIARIRCVMPKSDPIVISGQELPVINRELLRMVRRIENMLSDGSMFRQALAA